MSLTRKALTAMGIEADKIEQIIEMHTETVTALKEQNASLKEELETEKKTSAGNQDAQKELDKLRKQIEADTKEREGKDAEYSKLKEEYEKFKADTEAKETNAAKEKALRELLQDMKVSEKGIKQIIKWQGVNGVDLDENGKIKEAAALRKAVKDDWGDYIQTEETKGAQTATPPTNSGGGTARTKKEIMSIKDAGERQKAIAENPGLFGLPTE